MLSGVTANLGSSGEYGVLMSRPEFKPSIDTRDEAMQNHHGKLGWGKGLWVVFKVRYLVIGDFHDSKR